MTMEFQKEIQTLTRLGLSSSQAKVYLALATSSATCARSISQKAGVARQDIYRILLGLEKLGLIEKELSIPCRFQAIPITQAVSMLMEQRKNETIELRNELKELLLKFKNKNAERFFDQYAPQFVMIPQKTANLRKRVVLIKNALNNIDRISSQYRLQTIPSAIIEGIYRALQRGVRIRIVTEKPTEEKVSSPQAKNVKKYIKTGNFELRYILGYPHVVLSIYDEKEALITSSAKARIGESPALWTNNSGLVKALQEYFETLWLTSIKHDDTALANITA
jgi:sugar-specific transcriptional regulator TrmB